MIWVTVMSIVNMRIPASAHLFSSLRYTQIKYMRYGRRKDTTILGILPSSMYILAFSGMKNHSRASAVPNTGLPILLPMSRNASPPKNIYTPNKR